MRITRETIRVQNELDQLIPYLITALRDGLQNYTGPVLKKDGFRAKKFTALLPAFTAHGFSWRIVAQSGGSVVYVETSLRCNSEQDELGRDRGPLVVGRTLCIGHHDENGFRWNEPTFTPRVRDYDAMKAAFAEAMRLISEASALASEHQFSTTHDHFA